MGVLVSRGTCPEKNSKKRFGWYYKTPVTLGSVGWGSEQEIPLYMNVNVYE